MDRFVKLELTAWMQELRASTIQTPQNLLIFCWCCILRYNCISLSIWWYLTLWWWSHRAIKMLWMKKWRTDTDIASWWVQWSQTSSRVVLFQWQKWPLTHSTVFDGLGCSSSFWCHKTSLMWTVNRAESQWTSFSQSGCGTPTGQCWSNSFIDIWFLTCSSLSETQPLSKKSLRQKQQIWFFQNVPPHLTSLLLYMNLMIGSQDNYF